MKTNFQRSPLSPDYISGFVDGEGCFTIGLSRKHTLKFGVCITPSFSISQNTTSQQVLQEIQKYFGCGYIRRDRNTVKYEVRNFQDLQTKIRPHFELHPLHTQKRIDFQYFCLICDQIEKKTIKTHQHFENVVDIIYKMNNNGLNRRYSKEFWLDYSLSFEKEVKV